MGQPSRPSGLFPVIFCLQEIPCDPCTKVCPRDMIMISGDGIMALPEVCKDECTGCMKCVAICPGLAITLVDMRGDGHTARVTVAFELLDDAIQAGDEVAAVDIEGRVLATCPIVKLIKRKSFDRRILVTLEVPRKIATSVAGLRRRTEIAGEALDATMQAPPGDETIVCRCERVTVGQVRQLIRDGVRDMNQLKELRCGMGACGGKTCEPLILGIFRQEGIDLKEVMPYTKRPLLAETPLKVLAGHLKK